MLELSRVPVETDPIHASPQATAAIIAVDFCEGLMNVYLIASLDCTIQIRDFGHR